MGLQIRKPADNRYMKALFFAPAGAGKTVLMATAQEDERTSPMLLLDFEGGTESLAGLDIDYAEIRSWKDYNEAYELLASGDHGYKSVGIDSISETHKFALLEILRLEGPSRKDSELLEQRDYGKATVQMRRLLREFRDLPLHVFFSAHAKEVEIPREGRVRLPDLAGQMAEEVSGLVSVQGYLAQFEEDGENHRTLLLHSIPKFRIKARTPWRKSIAEEIIDPTVTDLLDVLGYGSDEAADKVRERGSSRGKEYIEPEEDKPTVEEAVSQDLVQDPEEEEEVNVKKEDNESDKQTDTEEDLNGDKGEDLEEDVQDTDDSDTEETPDFQKMTIGALRDYAAEHDVDLGDARTRRQILEVLKSLQAA